MIEYITISSIGVSKESQVRAAKIIGAVCDGCQGVGSDVESDNFFEYARDIMSKRWQKVRQALDHQNEYLNNLIKYPRQRCLFNGEFTESLPGIYFYIYICSLHTELCSLILKMQMF